MVCPTIFGNLLVGPTAEEQQSRSDASVDQQTLQQLQQKGEDILPMLKNQPITATYAGIRPATEFSDYQIHVDSDRHYVSVGGIRSTGLSAALGIATYVYRQLTGKSTSVEPSSTYTWPKPPNIAENIERDWQRPNNGGIVCHCEWVTRREIESAFDSAIPPNSLNGLKRRTRVTMGRCQGFYCSAELSEITSNRFKQNLVVVQDEAPT